jgi:flagellar motor component MotA
MLAKLFLMLLSFFGFYAVTLMNNISIINFIDLSTLILMLSALAYLMVAFQPQKVFQAIVDSLATEIRFELAGRYRVAAYIHQSCARYLFAFGLLGLLMGLVQSLGNIDTMSAFGASIALAILPLLYATVMSICVCLPLYMRARYKSQVLDSEMNH